VGAVRLAGIFFSSPYAGDMQLNNVGIASFCLLRRQLTRLLEVRFLLEG
jgi:hypothetical protein